MSSVVTWRIRAETEPGRICVPVNPSIVNDFDPDTVPTVGDLLNELDRLPPDNLDDKTRRLEGGSSTPRDERTFRLNSADYDQTSLKPYVELFEKHVAAILRDNGRQRRGEMRKEEVSGKGLMSGLSRQGGKHSLLGLVYTFSSCGRRIYCTSSY